MMLGSSSSSSGGATASSSSSRRRDGDNGEDEVPPAWVIELLKPTKDDFEKKYILWNVLKSRKQVTVRAAAAARSACLLGAGFLFSKCG